MIKIKIDEKKCKGCKLCVYCCPKDLIKESKTLNERGIYVVKFDDSKNTCIGCKSCAIICPEQAIEIIDDEKDEK